MRLFGLSFAQQSFLIHLSTSLLGAAIGVCVTAESASALTRTPFISNLNQTATGPTMFTTTSDLLAQSFTASAASSTVLYATLDLALQSTSVSTSDNVHLYLYADGIGTFLNSSTYLNSDQPTTQIADLGIAVVNSTTAANYTFSSTSSISLVANQQYWLVIQDDFNSNASWMYTTSTTYTGPATINSNAASGTSPDSGTNWLINGLNYTDPNNNQSVAYGAQLFEVGIQSGATPEPGSLLLFAGGVAGATTLRSLRQRRRGRTEAGGNR